MKYQLILYKNGQEFVENIKVKSKRKEDVIDDWLNENNLTTTSLAYIKIQNSSFNDSLICKVLDESSSKEYFMIIKCEWRKTTVFLDLDQHETVMFNFLGLLNS